MSDPALHLRAPAPQVNQRRHNAGTHLFREGDDARHVYEVKSGILRLTRVLENGRRQVIAFGLPGDIVGFPNGEHHHTDCDVLATAEIIAHQRHALETGEGDLATHQRLLHAALREISAMQDHFMMLARKSALEKVASFLIVLSQRTGTPIGNFSTVSLPMSRADIADFLGLTIETVSRTLTLLRKNGTIVLETPQTVLIRDMQGLIDASQADT
tara:strand:- start:59634 stop:60275 length:642 start_codon:yes stop_codon:yes gene_type:complete